MKMGWDWDWDWDWDWVGWVCDRNGIRIGMGFGGMGLE